MVVCTFVSVNCSGDLVVGPFEDLHRSVVKATVEQMLAVGGDFTALERAVLRAICDAHPKDRAALEVQLSTATVLNRENTGAGFYTRFSVKRASNTAIEGERLRRGPAARIDGLEHGMGFIL